MKVALPACRGAVSRTLAPFISLTISPSGGGALDAADPTLRVKTRMQAFNFLPGCFELILTLRDCFHMQN